MFVWLQIWYNNVPHTKLAAIKGHQNWVKMSGEHLTFPGGGTQFVNGALHYIDFIQEVTVYSFLITRHAKNTEVIVFVCSRILLLRGETEPVLYWMLGVELLASGVSFSRETCLHCRLHQRMSTRRKCSSRWSVVFLRCWMLWEPKDYPFPVLFLTLSIVLVVESLGILKVNSLCSFVLVFPLCFQNLRSVIEHV